MFRVYPSAPTGTGGRGRWGAEGERLEVSIEQEHEKEDLRSSRPHKVRPTEGTKGGRTRLPETSKRVTQIRCDGS